MLFPTTDTVGKPITDTCTVAKFVQVACEPIIEYVVVIVGLAVVLAVLVDVNAVLGIHVYVVAPLAVKLIELFKQINAGFGKIVTVGFGTTLAVAFCVWLLQPTLPPMILYTVVTAGLAITTGPFGVFKVADGVHVYICALFAVNVTLVPAHILPLVAVIVGFGTTVTV